MSDRTGAAAPLAPVGEKGAPTGLSSKGLSAGTVGLIGAVVIGISCIAPAYTLTAALGPTVSEVLRRRRGRPGPRRTRRSGGPGRARRPGRPRRPGRWEGAASRRRSGRRVRAVRVLRPEQQETEDEAEVRRVEDVRAAEFDHVLGKERDSGGAREDRPAVQAPPVAVLGPGNPQDEGDSVPGQHRARRPYQLPGLAEGQSDLDDGRGQNCGEYLRYRHPEPEGGLAQNVYRNDHRCQVQAGITNAW